MQATALTNTNRPLVTLRLGDRGDEVRLLQQQINRLRDIPGLTSLPSLRTDGILGSQTEVAVRQFQNLLNLVADGVVGRLTWTALFIGSSISTIDPATSPINVQFASGATTAEMENSVVRGTRDIYILQAKNGQRMTTSITSLENNAMFEIINVGVGTIVRRSTSWSFILPSTDVYAIVVSGIRGNATYKLRTEVV